MVARNAGQRLESPAREVIPAVTWVDNGYVTTDMTHISHECVPSARVHDAMRGRKGPLNLSERLRWQVAEYDHAARLGSAR